MFCRPVSVASCPVVGKVFGLTPWPCRKWMIGAPFSSFGMSAALMFLCAVYCCWNSDSAVGGSQVPAGLLTFVQPLPEKYGARTPSYPWANSVALLSVGAPFITMTLGFFTPQAVTQDTRPWPMTWPTLTLLKLT